MWNVRSLTVKQNVVNKGDHGSVIIGYSSQRYKDDVFGINQDVRKLVCGLDF